MLHLMSRPLTGTLAVLVQAADVFGCHVRLYAASLKDHEKIYEKTREHHGSQSLLAFCCHSVAKLKFLDARPHGDTFQEVSRVAEREECASMCHLSWRVGRVSFASPSDPKC